MTSSSLVRAESLGTYCWEQAPFAHIFCFDVEAKGQYFSLTGEDIAKAARYPIGGTALFDIANNVYRLEFTQNLGNIEVYENTAEIDPLTLNGTWTDDGGNSGEFKHLGMGPLGEDKINELTNRRAPRKIKR